MHSNIPLLLLSLPLSFTFYSSLATFESQQLNWRLSQKNEKNIRALFLLLFLFYALNTLSTQHDLSVSAHENDDKPASASILNPLKLIMEMKILQLGPEEMTVPGGCTVMVGIKLDSQSRELLTWAMVKVAQPGDTVIALHVLGNDGE